MSVEDTITRLLQVVRPEQTADEVLWMPVAGWAEDPDHPGCGLPWALDSARALSKEWWDYTALTAHFITGLRDVYEHTFDSWDRINENWHCQQLLCVDYHVEEAAKALGVSVDVADQFLMWRTIHTRIPGDLLAGYTFNALAWDLENLQCGHPNLEQFLEREMVTLQQEPMNRPLDLPGLARLAQEDPARAVVMLRDRIAVQWPSRCQMALERLTEETTGSFNHSAKSVHLFDVGTDVSFKARLDLVPSASPPLARLLDYALTANEVQWDDLFREESDGMLRLRDGGLTTLRAELERSDQSGRILLLDRAPLSDDSLRLLLRARLMNLVAPRGLWAEMGLVEQPDEAWRLPLAAAWSPHAGRPDTLA